jgi:hypothetical protein
MRSKSGAGDEQKCARRRARSCKELAREKREDGRMGGRKYEATANRCDEPPQGRRRRKRHPQLEIPVHPKFISTRIA